MRHLAIFLLGTLFGGITVYFTASRSQSLPFTQQSNFKHVRVQSYKIEKQAEEQQPVRVIPNTNEGSIHISAQILDNLLTALASDDFISRFVAIESLGNLGDARAVPKLIQLLDTKDGTLKNKVRVALLKIGSSAVPGLEEALLSKNQDNKELIADVLKDIGYAGIATLSRLAEDTTIHASDRQYTIKALGDTGLPESTETLYRIFETNHNERISAMSASALAKTYDPMIYRALLELVDRNDDFVASLFSASGLVTYANKEEYRNQVIAALEAAKKHANKKNTEDAQELSKNLNFMLQFIKNLHNVSDAANANSDE